MTSHCVNSNSENDKFVIKESMSTMGKLHELMLSIIVFPSRDRIQCNIKHDIFVPYHAML